MDDLEIGFYSFEGNEPTEEELKDMCKLIKEIRSIEFIIYYPTHLAIIKA